MHYRQPAAIFILLAAVYLGAMFLLTHLPINAPSHASGADKLVHAALYAGLALLLLAIARVFRPVGIVTAIGVVLLAAAYGAFDEWTQGFVPSRIADPWDWVADVLGASLSALVFLAGQRMLGGRLAKND